MSLKKYRSGLSLIELVVTITILSILAAGILPMARMASKRTKEIELRRNLRILRTALDDFKKTWDKLPVKPAESTTGYPKTLQTLIDGVDFGDKIKTEKKRFLRRKILDPFHPPESESDDKWGWELRSSIDQPDSSSWGGEDVFDVYSRSEDTAIDGTKYKEW